MNFTHLAHRTLGSLVFAGSLALVGCADPVSSAAALVTGERGITSIATDDFFLYYTKVDGSVKRVSLDGGKPTTLVSGQQAPRTVAVDETHLYWASSDGEIARSPKDGGGAEPLALAGDKSGLAVDSSHIYFTTSAGTVQKRSKQDGSTATLAAEQKVQSQFALSGLSLVWTAQSAGAINEMLTDSGAVDALISGQGTPDLVAISGSNIYWTNVGDQTVGVAKRDGSNVYQIPALGAQPSSVMGDDTYIYFADVSGAVNVAAIQGGDATQIAKGPTGKVSLTMDMTSIYWANSEDGAILAMPRQ